MSQETFPSFQPVAPLFSVSGVIVSRVVSLALAILILLPCLAGALDVPPLTGHVNDLAGVLTPETASRLERKLAGFEQQTSTQLVVLTVPSLQGDDIAAFAIRVAEQWQPGQKGKDNGLLLIIAPLERKARIEVGMGLQGVLPDITAGRIIRDVMRPHLQRSDYDHGVTAGVDAIIAATRGEFTASPRETARRHHRGGPSSLLTFLIFTGIAATALGSVSRPLGGIAGAIGLPLSAILAFPALGIGILVLLSAVGLVTGFILGAMARSGHGGGFGGFGGFGGGYRGGGSSGGFGGFSGGGGGFDGGGASGDW